MFSGYIGVVSSFPVSGKYLSVKKSLISLRLFYPDFGKRISIKASVRGSVEKSPGKDVQKCLRKVSRKYRFGKRKDLYPYTPKRHYPRRGKGGKGFRETFLVRGYEKIREKSRCTPYLTPSGYNYPYTPYPEKLLPSGV